MPKETSILTVVILLIALGLGIALYSTISALFSEATEKIEAVQMMKA